MLDWSRVARDPELDLSQLDRRSVLRLVGLYPKGELSEDFPGRDDVFDFISRQDRPDETLLPGAVEVQVSQTRYRRIFRVTLSDWKPRPEESGWSTLMTVGAAVPDDITPPTQPLKEEDRLLTVDRVALGMTAAEYLAMDSPPAGVRFRPDNDTVLFVTGKELRTGGDDKVFNGDQRDLVDMLTRMGYDHRDSQSILVFTNKRVLVTVRTGESGKQSFEIYGNLPKDGERMVDPTDPVMTIHGLSPGCTEAELLDKAGPADERLTENGQQVLRWGVWAHEPDELPGVRLEATLQNGEVLRLRGDQVEQEGHILLRWHTPLPPWWLVNIRDHGVEKRLVDQMEKESKYMMTAFQVADIDRPSIRKGPERVLEFTDRGLSIWEYPGARRQFQLVISEPPTLGVDLTYP